MSRGAVAELAPYLYQRGHTLTWPRAQKLELIEKHDIRLVINLWLKVDPDLSGACNYVNWPIPGDRVADDIDDVIGLAVASMHRKRGVLVHCEAGKNRSSYVATMAMVRFFGISGADAWAQVQERNPAAEMNHALLSSILETPRP